VKSNKLATFGSDREGENSFSTAVRQRQVDLLERHRYELHLHTCPHGGGAKNVNS
jgi:hypothetical protein